MDERAAHLEQRRVRRLVLRAHVAADDRERGGRRVVEVVVLTARDPAAEEIHEPAHLVIMSDQGVPGRVCFIVYKRNNWYITRYMWTRDDSRDEIPSKRAVSRGASWDDTRQGATACV